MTPQDSILLLGAGELGSEVLASLTTHPLRENTPITLLQRPSTISKLPESTLKHYANSNITLLPADISTASVPDLATLFAPFATIISCTGMALPAGTQLKLSRAVLAANVPRYIPWQFGLDYDAIGTASAQDLFDEQLEVRALLRGQESTKWAIVSTGMFMSFLFEEAFGVVDLQGERVVALGGWENELTVTEVGDIGRVVAELVLGDGGWSEESGVVFVAGDTISMRRLADLTEKLVGGKVRRELKDVEQLERELAEEPGDSMRKYRAVFAAGVGVSWDRKGTFNERRGMEMVSVQEWAKRRFGNVEVGSHQ